MNPNWSYSKTEGLPRGGKRLQEFSHLLVGEETTENRLTYFKTHDILVSQDGFVGIDFSWRRRPPVIVKTEPTVLVFRKKGYFGHGGGPVIHWRNSYFVQMLELDRIIRQPN